jgi:Putative quorum-sensing-regulated virulence factor
MSSYHAVEGPGAYPVPFGVHKGKRLREVPVSYLLWLLSIELKEPLKTAVRDLVEHLHQAAGREHGEALVGAELADRSGR